MRVLILSKRQYTGKDLLDDRFGRLFELPAALAKAGAEVRGVCVSYRRRQQGEFGFEGVGNLSWLSINALPGAARLPWQLASVVRKFRPDVIWASSDVAMLCAGAWLSGGFSVPLVADLYDNYESFGLSRLPGAVKALRWACRRASRITVVSHALAGFVGSTYGATAPIDVLPNGVRTDIFYPGDRFQARHELGLPVDARLIGTAGALVKERGIEDLIKAHARLLEDDPGTCLVLAGPRDEVVSRLPPGSFIDLGILPHDRIGTLFRALDAGVVCNRDSEFGRYCFPLKLIEMRACGLPVVAAAVGDVAPYLAGRATSLYSPGDDLGLARNLRIQLDRLPDSLPMSPPGWPAVSGQLMAILESAAAMDRL